MRSRPFAAVVFDLDGTLIDTEGFYRAAFHAAARRFGLAVPTSLYASLVGIASPERAVILRQAFGSMFPVHAFLAAYYEERKLHLPARIPLCRGAAALLARLDLPVAVATSASRRTALAHLGRAGLALRFRHLVTRDDVRLGKPAPDAFQRAAELLDVPPRACLAVEDSSHGVAAAHAAGMQVAVVAENPDREIARQCLAVVPGLDALFPLLTGLPTTGMFRDGSFASSTAAARNHT